MVPVPLILHLSDLHLAAGTDDEVFGDHKREVVRRADRQGRTNLIRSSLRALGAQLRRADRSLDALVISGDITDRGNPAGFALLTPTLRELGPVLPEPGQIMVVPGNHDVVWFTEPSSRDRYQGFLDGVRAQGYVTPLLEGIDIDLDGHRLPGAVDPLMQVADGTVVILGLNTANYCGVAEEADSETAEAVAELDLRLGGDPAYQRFRENWYRRGAFDLARLGSEQRRYGIEALEAGAANALVRVATMHHQLLPVGFDEEVKPFESLLNLAVTRSFLAEQRVDVLLHGHKHTADVYQDSPRPRHTSQARPLVVCSVRTVGKGQSSHGEIAKLIDINVTLPTVHHVGFSAVPACDDGATLPESVLVPEQTFTLGGGDPAHGEFTGATADQVHEQLLTAFPDDITPVTRPVVCRVADGASALRLPATFPPIPGHDGEERRQQWFSEMARQWQRRDPGPGLEFNHGQRLHSYWRGVDQVARVIDILARQPESSRGVAVLIDPTIDPIEDHTARFPAFVLCQFFIRVRALHGVAYFRKQEMRFWWAINAAEIAMLQENIASGLARRGRPVRRGSVTTITAIPASAESLPQVGIPVVDRIAADDATAIIQHGVPLVTSNVGAADTSDWWSALFDDWYPATVPVSDGDPAPVFGLRVVADTLDAVAAAYDATERASGLSGMLRQMAENNERYLEQLHRTTVSDQRDSWAQRSRGDIARAIGMVNSLLGI